MALSFELKIGIFVLLVIIIYFVLRYYDMDPLVATWETISEIEWNITVLILTLMISAIMWAVIWTNPFWVNSVAYGFKSKVFLTIVVPIVGYFLGLRAWNK